jgi:acyl carrier protein
MIQTVNLSQMRTSAPATACLTTGLRPFHTSVNNRNYGCETMPDITLDELRKLIVDNCVLKVKPDEIREDTPLFGPGSIGLDSLDALQLTVAIEQQYGIAINDAKVARQALQSLDSLRHWLAQQAGPGKRS